MNDDRLGLPSCSSLARLKKCPYSVRYDTEQEQQVDSPMAKRGTRIHAFLSGEPIPLNKEEAGIAKSCQIVARRVIDEWANGEGIQELLNEERVFYEDHGEKIFSGKPDLVVAKRDSALKGHLLILDYKTGPIESDGASTNYQLRGLAVAIRNFIKREFEEDVETISCAIIQPLVTWEPVVVTYNHDHLEKAEKEILSILPKDEDIEPIPNEYCQYCNGFVTCPACIEKTGEIAILRPNVHDMILQSTPQKRRELYNTATLAMKTAQAIMTACKEVLQQGEPIYGLTLKDGKRYRKMSIESLRLIGSNILPSSSIDKCCSVSVSSLYEEFYKMKNMYERTTHSQCKEMFDNIFGDYIDETISAPVIHVNK